MSAKYVWPLAASLGIAVLGAALMIWPFAAHTNAGGWTRGVSTDFWSGLGLAVAGLAGLAGWYGGLRQELVQRGLIVVKRPESRQEPPATVATADEDLDRLLRPLAESVLRDLTEQLAAKEGRSGGGAS